MSTRLITTAREHYFLVKFIPTEDLSSLNFLNRLKIKINIKQMLDKFVKPLLHVALFHILQFNNLLREGTKDLEILQDFWSKNEFCSPKPSFNIGV